MCVKIIKQTDERGVKTTTTKQTNEGSTFSVMIQDSVTSEAKVGSDSISILVMTKQKTDCQTAESKMTDWLHCIFVK